jgi:hypothetical protein
MPSCCSIDLARPRRRRGDHAMSWISLTSQRLQIQRADGRCRTTPPRVHRPPDRQRLPSPSVNRWTRTHRRAGAGEVVRVSRHTPETQPSPPPMFPRQAITRPDGNIRRRWCIERDVFLCLRRCQAGGKRSTRCWRLAGGGVRSSRLPSRPGPDFYVNAHRRWSEGRGGAAKAHRKAQLHLLEQTFPATLAEAMRFRETHKAVPPSFDGRRLRHFEGTPSLSQRLRRPWRARPPGGPVCSPLFSQRQPSRFQRLRNCTVVGQWRRAAPPGARNAASKPASLQTLPEQARACRRGYLPFMITPACCSCCRPRDRSRYSAAGSTRLIERPALKARFTWRGTEARPHRSWALGAAGPFGNTGSWRGGGPVA